MDNSTPAPVLVKSLYDRIACYEKNKSNAANNLLKFWNSWKYRKKQLADLFNEPDEIAEEYKKVIERSDEQYYYFAYCSFKCFLNFYEELLVDYLDYNPDSRERDLAQDLLDGVEENFTSVPEVLKNPYENSYRRKKEFLLSKIEHSNIIQNSTIEKTKKTSKSLSNFYAVRILDHFGVIDSLLERGHTQEKISKILGEILGKHHQNIRSEITDRAKPTTKEKEKKLKDLIDRFDNL